MSWIDAGLLYLAVLVGCLFGGVGIGVVMGLVGIMGLTISSGTAMWPTLADIIWNTGNEFSLVAIPLFLLMAEIILQSGIATRFYSGATRWFRNIPGGLAQTNIAGCAVFSAVAGSSVATALTIGSVAVKEMRARGYSDKLTLGSLTAGGCLGILIPPSIPLIVYSAMTSESVIDLFMAGLIPGLALAACFSIFIVIRTWLQPNLVPSSAQVNEEQSLLSTLWDVVPVFFLIVSVIGGMYGGVVTPTEAAALGSLIALILAFAYRQMTWGRLWTASKNAVLTSAVIMFITFCANVLSYAVQMARIGQGLTEWVLALNLSPLIFFMVIILIYLVIGVFIDGLSIMLLTVPILYPPLTALGFNGVWLGIVIVLFIELGALTPPVGLNLFAIQSVAKGTTLADVAWSSMPYSLIIIGFSFGLYFFPEIALWLPAALK